MIVFGKQNVLYLLEHMKESIQEVYFSKEIDKKIFSRFVRLGCPVIRIDNKKAQALAKGGNHQGFFAKIKPLESTDFGLIKTYKKIVVLCGVTDVGNIGSIIRSAYALGVEAIVISGVRQFNIEGVIRSSVGSIFHLPFCVYENTLSLINELKNHGLVCVGTSMSGIDVKEYQSPDKWALFLGNEGSGLGNKILSKLDTILTIKMARSFDSLNVAVAAGILMHRI